MSAQDDLAYRLARQRASVDRKLKQLKASAKLAEDALKEEKLNIDRAISEFVNEFGPYMTLAGELTKGPSVETAVEDDEKLLAWAVDNLLDAVSMKTSVTALLEHGCKFVPDPNGSGELLVSPDGEPLHGVYRRKVQVSKFKPAKSYVDEGDDDGY